MVTVVNKFIYREDYWLQFMIHKYRFVVYLEFQMAFIVPRRAIFKTACSRIIVYVEIIHQRLLISLLKLFSKMCCHHIFFITMMEYITQNKNNNNLGTVSQRQWSIWLVRHCDSYYLDFGNHMTKTILLCSYIRPKSWHPSSSYLNENK